MESKNEGLHKKQAFETKAELARMYTLVVIRIEACTNREGLHVATEVNTGYKPQTLFTLIT